MVIPESVTKIGECVLIARLRFIKSLQRQATRPRIDCHVIFKTSRTLRTWRGVSSAAETAAIQRFEGVVLRKSLSVIPAMRQGTAERRLISASTRDERFVRLTANA